MLKRFVWHSDLNPLSLHESTNQAAAGATPL
jgi:hypothetical protein